VGLPVEVAAPTVDEASIHDADPVRLAVRRARGKADSVAGPGRLVIGSDQVVHLDGRVFGKPRDAAAHLAQLRALRGRTHQLTDGVAVVGEGTATEFAVHAHVTLRADLGDDELAAYVASGDAAGCAGGYRVEGPGAWLVERIDGDWFTVVGLPVYQTLSALRGQGWRPPLWRHTTPPLPNGQSA